MREDTIAPNVIGLLAENERRRASTLENLRVRLMGDDIAFVEELIRKANAFDFIVTDPSDRGTYCKTSLFIGRGTPGDMYCSDQLTDENEALGAIEEAKATAFEQLKENK